MSRNTKIILAIVAGLSFICCIGAATVIYLFPRVASNIGEESFVSTEEKAAEIGASIIDYELPPGFSEATGMDFLGMRMVLISSSNRSGMMITLTQLPSSFGTNEEEFRRQAETLFEEQSGQRNTDLTAVESQTVTINGAPAILTTYQGSNGGTEIRQVSGFFEGNDGKVAMLMVSGPVGSWNQEAFDTFIKSLE